MDLKHPSAGNSPGKPGAIPFSMSWADQVLEGAIAISPCAGNPHVLELEFQLAGRRLGSATLTEESALDLALRLVATIMDRRRAREVTVGASAPYCAPSSEGSPAVAEPFNSIDQGLRSGVHPNLCSHSSIRSK
jgi:hypothetical protein